MFQILMAVIGMTMAGALGFAMIEQQNMQGAMNISREDNRRLDAAADVLSRNLVEAPALNIAMAPQGVNGSTYYELPIGINIVKTNSQGIPFQYCPLAPLNQKNETGGGTTNGTLQVAGGSNYAYDLHNGGIVSENAVIDASVRAVSPVAILTSGVKGATLPPPCNAVRMVGGRAIVPNGIARVITISNSGTTTRASKATQATYYVSQSGSGDKTGKDGGNTAVADQVWRSLYKNRTASADIYLTTNIATGTNWSNFVKTGLLINTEIQIIGNGANGFTMSVPAGVRWDVYGKLSLTNMRVSTAGFYISPRGRITVNGVNRFLMSSAGSAPFDIAVHGELFLKNADVAIDYQGFPSNGIMHNSGRATYLDSAITAAATPSLAHFLVTYGGGLTILENSTIGKTNASGSFRADMPVYSVGGGRYIFQNAFILRGTQNQCHLSIGTPTFDWSADGPGTTSGIPPETSYPPPAAGYTQASMALYSDQVASRKRARENNSGSASCVES